MLDALGHVSKPVDNKIMNFSSTSDQGGVEWLDLLSYLKQLNSRQNTWENDFENIACQTTKNGDEKDDEKELKQSGSPLTEKLELGIQGRQWPGLWEKSIWKERAAEREASWLLAQVVMNTHMWKNFLGLREGPPERTAGSNPWSSHSAWNNPWDPGEKACVCLSSGAKLALY